MRKKLFSVAVLLCGMVGFSAAAQTPVEEVTEVIETVQTTPDNVQKAVKGQRDGKSRRNADGRECQKNGRKDGHKGFGRARNGNGDNAGRGQRPDLFEGITLTADQQARLEALKPSCPNPGVCNDPTNCQNVENAKCRTGENGKADGQRPDKADRKAAKQQYLNSVKEILTPDQYVKFLENAFLSGGGRQGGNHHGGGRR